MGKISDYGTFGLTSGWTERRSSLKEKPVGQEDDAWSTQRGWSYQGLDSSTPGTGWNICPPKKGWPRISGETRGRRERIRNDRVDMGMETKFSWLSILEMVPAAEQAQIQWYAKILVLCLPFWGRSHGLFSELKVC